MRGSRAIALAQVRASRPDGKAADGLRHLTLTVTHDGRVIQRVSMQRSAAHWRYYPARVVGRASLGRLDQISADQRTAYAIRALENLARELGYMPDPLAAATQAA